MANKKVTAVFEVQVKGKNVKVVAKDTEKLGKNTEKAARQTDKLNRSTDKLTKTRDKYQRTEKGVAGMSSNSTKNFSKMQQSIGGEGGSGGLVRAYALLAANVFALSAAFGILSRSAQIDTLIESIEQLEVVSGKSIRATARDLQEAARFGLSYAEALRSVSLATSAGFGSEEIQRLGEVATNAAISLGRNLPDALDRIFRGVIKVEPELLDEIGLFVRVNEAASKYAADLGVAVGDLTEFQRRQAFLNEAIEQGEKKFSAFSEVETDPFAKLATTFADITQTLLNFANRAIKPVVNLLAENKVIFTTVFIALAGALVRLAVPAFGAFTQSIAANAAATQKAAEKAKNLANERGQQNANLHKQFLQQEKEKLQAEAARIRAQNQSPAKLRVRGRDASANLEAALLKSEVQGNARLQIIKQRLADIDSNRGKKQRQNNVQIQKEKALLEQEKVILEQILQKEQQIRTTRGLGVAKESLTQTQLQNARLQALRAESVANIVNTAQTQGLTAAFKSINIELSLASQKAAELGVKFNIFSKAVIVAKGLLGSLAVGIQNIFEKYGGLISTLFLLLPLIQKVAEQFGFNSKEQQNLAESTRNADEQFALLDRRVKLAQVSLIKYKDNIVQLNKVNEGFITGILTTTEALRKQVSDFEIANDLNPMVMNVYKLLSISTFGLFGENTQKEIASNGSKLVSIIRKNGFRFSEEANKIADDINKGLFIAVGDFSGQLKGMDNEKLLKLVDAIKKQADAFKNVRSAIDGAVDSARKFSSSLIVKTDVDNVLATFRQLETSLQSSDISAEDLNNFIKEIAENGAIATLLSQDQRDALEGAKDNAKDALDVITDIKDTYFLQQEALLRQKETIREIETLNKTISKVTKFSTEALKLQVVLQQRQRNLEKQLVEDKLQNLLTTTGLRRAEVEQLADRKTLLHFIRQEQLQTENIVQVQAAINQLQKLRNMELEEQLLLASQQAELSKAEAQIAQKLLDVQLKLNKEKDKGVKLDAQIRAFGARGASSLTSREELALIVSAEKRRQDTLEKRKSTAETLARVEFDIAEAQLRALILRAEIINREEQLEREKEINALKRRAGIDGLSGANLEKAKQFLRESGQGGLLDRIDELTTKPLSFDTSKMELNINELAEAGDTAVKAVGEAFDNEAKEFAVKLIKNFEKTFGGSDAGATLFKGLQDTIGAGDQIAQLLQLTDKNGDPLFTQEQLQLKVFEQTLLNFADNLTSVFGEDGAFPAAMGRATANLVSIFDTLGDTLEQTNIGTAETVAAVSTAIAGSLQQMSSVFTAYSQQAIREIDNQIAAEKARDGASAASLAKIEQLEKKKEAMAKKQFDINKKIQMASAIASTAAGVAGALALTGTIGPVAAGILAGIIGAMGAAQIAIISKLKYEGSNAGGQAAKPTNLSIGNRSSAVDVSRGATAGELSYLRGGSTTGQDIGGAGASFPGAAMGRRGYADGGVVVGERGPEVITPATPVDITPNYALGGQPTNVNFTINAVDAAGVEDVLMNQRGNLIRMIRQAANENGQDFLPDVDTMAYGSKT